MRISIRNLLTFTCMSLVLLFQVSSAQTVKSTVDTQFFLNEDVSPPSEFVETIPSNLDLEKNIPAQSDSDVSGEMITIPSDNFLDEGGFVDPENEFIVDVDIDDEGIDDEDDITDPSHYRLRVGDILILAIYGEPDTLESVSIDPSGNLSYLFAHDIKAYGKTIAELREELKSGLEKYYKYPIVLITPEQFVPQYYTILGEVNTPGVKQIHGNSSLIKAFAESGGFTTRIYRDQTMFMVDFDRCFLSRKGECLLKIDFEELMNGDFSQNIKLEPEDFIYIASNDKQRVFVLGEVARPGTYDFFGSMSLIEALALSGGLSADASSRVSVIRGALNHPTQYLIDVNLIMRGRARDFALKPSDIVYFPPRRFTNLRLFAQAAIRGFVGNATSQAGNSAFIQTTPAAAGERATGSTLDFGPASSPTVIVP